MKRITIYRHKDCARCAKISRVHTFFDWLGRVECSTEEAPSGPLRMGGRQLSRADREEMGCIAGGVSPNDPGHERPAGRPL